VLCILGLALYPQLILHRTDPSVEQTVAKVTGAASPEAQLASEPRNRKGSEWTGYAPVAKVQAGSPE
jgi:hypothetical protein